MMKKNVLWFSEINPEYQEENTLLKKLRNDSKIELRNIRHCFEPDNRQVELRSSKEAEGDLKTLTIEAGPEVLFRESYFADAVLMSKSIYQTNLHPDHLKDIHCPIVLFPEEIPNINHLLFIINSSPDSVISIKQFCCLFQHVCKKAKITLLVIDDGDGLQKQNEQLLVNYLRKWNRNLGVFKDQHWNFEELKNYLEFDEKTMCVMNKNLLLESEPGSFPKEIFENDSASLFIGYNN